MQRPRTNFEELVMRALLDAHPAPLSDEEVAIEVGDGVQAGAVLQRFVDQSIVHERAGLYWLTRSAETAARLAASPRDVE